MHPYKIQDLGTLPGGDFTDPKAINNKGEVVGTTVDSLHDNQAFLWKASTGLKALPVLPGSRFSSANGINDKSEIVGNCSRVIVPVNYSAVATHWKAGIVYDISNGEHSRANSINNKGEIAGEIFNPNTRQLFACTWKGGIINLLQLANYHGSYEYVSCRGLCIISNGEVYGDIVKSLLTSIYPYETALRWDVAGNVHELDFPDNQDAANGTRGRDSGVYAANDSGVAVGGIFDYINFLPFFWSPTGFKGALGLLPGTVNGKAYDINEDGQIVGWVEDATRQSRATIWNGPIVTDLNTLIDPSSGWILTHANCLNNRGQIAGVGLLNGQRRGWLMSPAFRTFKIPAMVWHIIFGVVADGPGIIIGPRGPQPVPPWNPMIRSIAEPYRTMIKELLQNQTIPTTKKKKGK